MFLWTTKYLRKNYWFLQSYKLLLFSFYSIYVGTLFFPTRDLKVLILYKNENSMQIVL